MASAVIDVRHRELFLWVTGILAVGHFLRFHTLSRDEVLQSFLTSITSRSVFQYLAWYVVFWLLAGGGASRPASRLDGFFGLVASLVALLPSAFFGWLSITAVGLYLLASSPSASKTRGAAIVLLALSINGYWAPKFFSLFGIPLMQAEAAIVWASLSLTGTGMSLDGTQISSAEHSIVVVGGCSAFHNVSTGLLCWVALTMLVRPTWAPRDVSVALLVCAAVVLLNTVRLHLLALSYANYAYWELGAGATLLLWAIQAVVVAISLYGALRARRTV